jgi:hypothetical protein
VQVHGQPVQHPGSARGESGTHPLVKLAIIEPAFGRCALHALRDGVPVLVGYAG